MFPLLSDSILTPRERCNETEAFEVKSEIIERVFSGERGGDPGDGVFGQIRTEMEKAVV